RADNTPVQPAEQSSGSGSRFARVTCQFSGRLFDFPSGQRETKTCASAGIVFGPDFSPVSPDDAAADGQTKPQAVRFGGVKCVEDAGQIIRRNPAAAIGDSDA